MIISGKVVAATLKMEHDDKKQPLDALTMPGKPETCHVMVEKELSKASYTDLPSMRSSFTASPSKIIICYHTLLSFQGFVLVNFTYKVCLIADQKKVEKVCLAIFYVH